MGSLSSPSEAPSKSKTLIDQSELRRLFDAQRQHLDHFFTRLDLSQAQAFAQALLDAPGAVFFTGVGKSGIVARKIASTLASLGFPRSAFLDPVDALHGDIGAVSPSDLLVLFSKSGASEELMRLVPCARARGAYLVSVTSSSSGKDQLSDACDLAVHLPVEREICPFDLAPVTSAAIQMIFGDTVAVALMAAKKLSRNEYAANHPAGRIGKSLIFRASEDYQSRCNGCGGNAEDGGATITGPIPACS
ncbi:putative arabinose 5-phosphate isomerase [Acorus calamus]|uniref:Arabinose 5-phosphate isomerase n=1 Tax=Acorus calamus TaxID=4465 RepID=A0AAV9C5C0_ACOCL|nr:putative arabinose 5-phosphate isomerase [Acorus calamus]